MHSDGFDNDRDNSDHKVALDRTDTLLGRQIRITPYSAVVLTEFDANTSAVGEVTEAVLGRRSVKIRWRISIERLRTKAVTDFLGSEFTSKCDKPPISSISEQFSALIIDH